MDDFDTIMGGGAPAKPAAGGDPLRAKVQAKAKQYGIPEDIADRWVQQESQYNPKATSKRGAMGLTQLMPETAKELGVTDAYDEDQNLDGGARYLAQQYAKYKDWPKALAAYNAGAGAVDKAGGIPDFPETQHYVKTIMGQPDDVDAFDAAMMGAGGADAPPTPEEEAAFAARYGDPSKLTGDDVKLVGLSTGKGTANAAQSKTLRTLDDAGAYDVNAPAGAINHPFALHPDVTEKDVPDGAYYVPEEGGLKLKGDKKGSLAAGFGQGVGDIATTAMAGINAVEDAFNPDSGESEILTALEAGKLRYNAQYEGDLGSSLGRFTGQVVGAAPVLAGVEAAAAPYMAGSAFGRFVAGKAGGNLLQRGGSLATKGAVEGAGSAALVSSANEEPLWKQLAVGAGAGAILGPALPAVTKVGRKIGESVRDFGQKFTEGGREKIVSRLIGEVAPDGTPSPDLRPLIPGSQPTLGEASGNAGIASLERNARTNPKLVERFTARETANKEARKVFLENVRGDRQTAADLVTARKGVVDTAREAAFKETRPTDPATLVTALDDALSAPEAHMDEVARPLQAIRDKIVQAPPETTPAQTAEFVRAVSRTFGADAPALTPEVMSEARSRLGSKFEEIAGKTTMNWDDEALSGIVRVISDTAQVVPESSLPPLFKQLANISSTVKNGEAISGASYQALTKKGAPLSTLQQAADPTIRNAANQIREVLDDALERTVAGEPAGKAMLDDLRATRLAYKNLKTVEAALRTAGPDKQVTPAAVLSAVKRNFGQFAYKGGGELGDAAEAAVREQATRGPVIEADPRQLYGMRESLSGAIDKLEAKGTDSAQLAADHLKKVRDSLDTTIEVGAAGYRNFLEVTQSSNEPVQAMRYLQDLNLTDAHGVPTFGRVQSALDRIEAARAKPGKNAAKSITDATLSQLTALRDDLKRATNIDLGKARGSDTRQNLVMDRLAEGNKMPLGLGTGLATGSPVVGAAVGAGKAVLDTKNQKLLDQMGSRLLNPQEVPAGPRPPVRKKGRLVGKVGEVVLPVAGGIAANAILGQR